MNKKKKKKKPLARRGGTVTLHYKMVSCVLLCKQHKDRLTAGRLQNRAQNPPTSGGPALPAEGVLEDKVRLSLICTAVDAGEGLGSLFYVGHFGEKGRVHHRGVREGKKM